MLWAIASGWRLAGRPETFDWPAVDENDAAALCYTSGTTGNPKGVAYSHRSIWLHSMEVCMSETFGLGPADRELVIVPMFHAMAWGLPYASFMGGASMVMPDRFLQAAPIATMIAQEKPTHGGAVPTIWTDLLAHLEAHPTGDGNNTAAFVCRAARRQTRWSAHAYGLAIDVNPVENPYIESGRVHPRAGRAYLNRSRVRRGMAVPGGALVGAFASVGWSWGGRWTSAPDYQHFSRTGG